MVLHRILFITLFLSICYKGNTQQKPLHILQKEISSYLSPDQAFEERKDIFLTLVNEGYHPDTLISYCEDFYKYCIEHQRYDTAAEVAGILSNRYNAHRNQQDASMRIMQDIIQYYSHFKDPYSRGVIFSKLGGIYFNKGKMDSALFYYKQAIPHFSIQNKLSEADMYFFSGQAYANLDSLAKGSQYFTAAYQIYKERGDSVYMAESLSEQASLFAKNSLYEESLRLMNRSDEISTALNLQSRLATNDKNRAEIYKQTEQYALERQFLENALQHNEKAPNPYFYQKYRIWCSLASNQIKMNRSKTAKTYLDSIETHLDYHKYNFSTKIHYLIAKLQYLTARRSWSTVKIIAQELESLYQQQESKELASASMDALVSYFKGIKDHKKALLLSENQLLLQRNKTKNVLKNQLAYHQTEFDLSTKNYEIENQKLRIDNFENRQNSLRNQSLLGIALLTAMFLVIYFMRARRAAKKETAMQQHFANQLIEQQEYEKKSVSETLHDSIGQSLLLIKNKIHPDRDHLAKSLLNDTIMELSEISRSLHPVQVKQLGLTKAIQKNIDQVDKASQTYFSTKMDNINGLFTERQELHIYRIIQEILTNVMKHAKATACKVSIFSKPHFIEIEIKDNGIGFDFTQEFDKIDSLGLKTMKSRISDLNAQFTLDSTLGSGTKIQIIIPKNNDNVSK